MLPFFSITLPFLSNALTYHTNDEVCWSSPLYFPFHPLADIINGREYKLCSAFDIGNGICCEWIVQYISRCPLVGYSTASMQLKRCISLYSGIIAGIGNYKGINSKVYFGSI